MDRNSSYLLIADESLELSVSEKKKKQLQAHLKHSLLFEDRLLISDSQLIGNRNFRRLIREHDPLIGILNEENFSIAVRNYIDILCPIDGSQEIIHSPQIDDLLQGFLSWDKCKWHLFSGEPKETALKEYSQTHDLEFMFGKANKQFYDLSEICSQYTTDVLALFRSDQANQILGESVAQLIHDLAKQKMDGYHNPVSPEGGLGYAYFTSDLTNDLKKQKQLNIWKSNSNDILKIAQAPYVTALPKILSCTPIYGQFHKSSVDLSHGIVTATKKIQDDLPYKTRLLRYEEGLCQLSPETILKLRESEEFSFYRNRMKNFNGSEESLNLVCESLTYYKNRIDDAILQEFPYLKEVEKQVREIVKPLEFVSTASGYGGIFVSGLALATVTFTGINLLSLGLGLLSFMASRAIKQKIIKTTQDGSDQAREKVLQDLNQHSTFCVDAESKMSYGNEFQNEVFYKGA